MRLNTSNRSVQFSRKIINFIMLKIVKTCVNYYWCISSLTKNDKSGNWVIQVTVD